MTKITFENSTVTDELEIITTEFLKDFQSDKSSEVMSTVINFLFDEEIENLENSTVTMKRIGSRAERKDLDGFIILATRELHKQSNFCKYPLEPLK